MRPSLFTNIHASTFIQMYERFCTSERKSDVCVFPKGCFVFVFFYPYYKYRTSKASDIYAICVLAIRLDLKTIPFNQMYWYFSYFSIKSSMWQPLEAPRHFITKTCLYNFDPPWTPLLYSKTGVYRGIHYFSYFCSKHRLWVLVRTASPRRF